jgi:hypothetical protein
MVQLLNLLAQLLQTQGFVLVLTAMLAGCNDQTRRQVFESNRTLGLVDVLTSRATGTECLRLAFPQQFLIGFRQ